MRKKVKFINNNSLEKYRFKSLLTKEPETIFWIKNFKKNEVLIDVGSNVGIYSLFAGKKEIKTYSIEPFKKNYQSLKKNIKLNRLKNITPLNYAISNFNGKAFFHNGGDNRFGATGGFLSKKKLSNTDKSISVKTLDSLIKKFKIKNNFHVKIDIDIGLLNLLKGFKKSVKNTYLKSVLIEADYKEKTKVLKFFKPYMKVLKLEKTVKNHSTIRRKKKNSSIRNIVFLRK